MTAREMESTLVDLGQVYIRTRREDVRAEYRRLHALWTAQKVTTGDHAETACNEVVTDERARVRDHVTTVILKEYARGDTTPNALRVEEWNKVVTWSPHVVPQQNETEQSGHAPIRHEQLVPCPACHAPTGKPCVNRTKKPYRSGTASHTARQDRFSLHKMFAAGRQRVSWRRRTDGKTLIEAATHCALCNKELHPLLAHIDHIVPFGLGGVDELHNLRIVCRDCNLRRRRDGSDLTEPLADLYARGLVISTPAWSSL